MGNQRLLCGYGWQLRPYSHSQLQAARSRNVDPKAKDLAWPTTRSFKYHNVDMPQTLEVHFHGSLRFCTTSTLQLFIYRTPCLALVPAQRYHMTVPLATAICALFIGRGLVITTHAPTSLTWSFITPYTSWT